MPHKQSTPELHPLMPVTVIMLSDFKVPVAHSCEQPAHCADGAPVPQVQGRSARTLAPKKRPHKTRGCYKTESSFSWRLEPEYGIFMLMYHVLCTLYQISHTMRSTPCNMNHIFYTNYRIPHIFYSPNIIYHVLYTICYIPCILRHILYTKDSVPVILYAIVGSLCWRGLLGP